MALNTTTLTNAIGANDTTFVVASTTNITAPNFTTGVGITYLLVEQEYMLVVGVPVAGTVNVQRGYLGSPVAAHGATAGVVIGLPTDFPAPPISVKAQQDYLFDQFAVGAPVASAATMQWPTSQFFHITGTTAITTITNPVGFFGGGPYFVVFDSTAAFTAGNNIGVSVTGAAGKMVVVCYDTAAGKWYSTT